MQKTETAKPEALDLAAELDQIMRKLSQAKAMTAMAQQELDEAGLRAERLQRLLGGDALQVLPV